ncbi:hypothetical protein BGP_1210 [Beggiatoa sp. PS]|nr:hypothetical protein BGP_1210 [Beggiatoa sp. PS]
MNLTNLTNDEWNVVSNVDHIQHSFHTFNFERACGISVVASQSTCHHFFKRTTRFQNTSNLLFKSDEGIHIFV